MSAFEQTSAENIEQENVLVVIGRCGSRNATEMHNFNEGRNMIVHITNVVTGNLQKGAG